MTKPAPRRIAPHIAVVNGTPTTTSRDIAETFGKPHKDVLTRIRALDCSPEFNQRNFSPVEYTDAKGEKRPEYRITRDGFAFLCMGFTGAQAAKWKERYIATFNKLADKVAARIAAPLKAAPLVLAAPEPGIDVRKRLLDGQSNPPECGYPPEVERAIDHAAWRLAREAYELVHIYLRRRVGYHHIFGYPVKKIDIKGAMSDVNRITLGQCLTNEATMYTEHATNAVRCALLAAQGASADMEKLLAELPSLHLNIPKE